MKTESLNENFELISIVGYDRSGTTLVGKLLSKYDSVEYYGELDKTYDSKPHLSNRQCSCGQFVPSCKIWGMISTRKIKKPYDLIVQLITNSSNNTIVDSSKNIDFLKELQSYKNDIKFIHIIRNPKGVVYSRMKTRKRRVKKGTHPNMKVAKRYFLMLIYDSFEWVVTNYKIEKFKKKNSNFTTVFYENLQDEMSRIIRLTNLEKETDQMYVVSDKVDHHVLYGNINRFKNVRMPIKTDESWKSGLNFFQKIVVGIITYPAILFFKYKF